MYMWGLCGGRKLGALHQWGCVVGGKRGAFHQWVQVVCVVGVEATSSFLGQLGLGTRGAWLQVVTLPSPHKSQPALVWVWVGG